MCVGVLAASNSGQLLDAFSAPAPLAGALSIAVVPEANACLIGIDVKLDICIGLFVIALCVVERDSVIRGAAKILAKMCMSVPLLGYRYARCHGPQSKLVSREGRVPF
jgi:hypothetical protein